MSLSKRNIPSLKKQQLFVMKTLKTKLLQWLFHFTPNLKDVEMLGLRRFDSFQSLNYLFIDFKLRSGFFNFITKNKLLNFQSKSLVFIVCTTLSKNIVIFCRQWSRLSASIFDNNIKRCINFIAGHL